MADFEKLTLARLELELSERASIRTIQSRYREMVKQWHPDLCHEDKAACEEKTRRLTDAYRTLMEYAKDVPIAFTEENAAYNLSPQEFWRKRFGDGMVPGADNTRSYKENRGRR